MNDDNRHLARLIRDGVYTVVLLSMALDGIPHYIYLAVKLDTLPKMSQALKNRAPFAPEDYGRVLASGMGAEAPLPVQRHMAVEYGFDHDSPLKFEV